MSVYSAKILNFTRDNKHYLVVIFSLLVSMVTGYLRQTSIAFVFGVNQDTDIFLISYTIPEFVFVALPIILTPAIIPFFIKARKTYGDLIAWSFVKKIFYFVTVSLLFFISLIFLFKETILNLLAPGFTTEMIFVSNKILLIMLPGIFFMGLAVLMGSFLQVYKKFARPILMTAVYNVVFIAALFLFPDQNSLIRASWGVTLGSFFALLLQIPLFLHYIPKKIDHSKSNINHSEWLNTLKFTAWLSVGYLTHHLIYFIDRSMASTLGDGKVAILNFAYHLALSVGQISGLAVSIVVFPNLTEKISDNLITLANRELSKALKYVVSLSVPITVGLLLFRNPLVRLLYEHGEFSSAETLNVSNVLIFYAIAVFFDAVCQPFWRYVYAIQKGFVVFGVNLAQTAVRIAANFLFIQIIGYNGIALSAVLGLIVQMFILGQFIKHKYKFLMEKEDQIFILKILISSIFSASIIHFSVRPLMIGFSTLPFLVVAGALFVVLIGFFYLIMQFDRKKLLLKGDK